MTPSPPGGHLAILVDMNLSVDWEPFLVRAGYSAVHWSTVGDPRADDATIMAWARSHGHVVFTNDLDFGTLLALTGAAGPSVIQARASNLLPAALGTVVLAALHQCEQELMRGALVAADERRRRIRVLPL